MSHDMMRWIEDAEARRFQLAVAFEREPQFTESHYLHLGHAVVKIPSWLRALTHLGSRTDTEG